MVRWSIAGIAGAVSASLVFLAIVVLFTFHWPAAYELPYENQRAAVSAAKEDAERYTWPGTKVYERAEGRAVVVERRWLGLTTTRTGVFADDRGKWWYGMPAYGAGSYVQFFMMNVCPAVAVGALASRVVHRRLARSTSSAGTSA